ncbi:MAG: aquaporin [SAR202 cluster bacterium]|nr:aquaporin [SAR202 cluster bacterium]
MNSYKTLLRPLAAECVGTFLLVFFGTGIVATSVLTGAQVGLWQVAVVWGIGVALAIYATAAVSGAHLNPAVSLAFALLRPKDFPVRNLAPYWAAQLAGGVLAGLAVFGIFHEFILEFETANALIRGAAGSERAAMVFGEYFPNPAMFGSRAEGGHLVAPWMAAVVEGLGTAVLGFVIFALVDRRNRSLTAKYLAPVLIGATIAALISLFAPITQAGWNPARDFGPRIVAFFAGWDGIAIPGPSNGFWVYIVGPLVGAPAGAAIYDYVVRPGLKPEPPAGSEVADDD